jgi:FtsP/CotA-like multicopper oxidase with cupredoxin domain
MSRRVAFYGVVVLLAAAAAAAFIVRSGQPPGATRRYYIAADEVDWNYAPSGRDLILDRPLDTTFEELGVHGGAPVAATIFRKAIYREYTDSTFTTLKPRPAQWQHLGILGPVLRGAVGDTIVVVFKNNTHFPASVHPHGVFYTKSSEGALYVDGTSGVDKDDDAVPTGGVHRYVWSVPERAGPGPNDPSSVVWVYHSHHKELEDVHSGLIGAIIVTRRGMARADGSPRDVDREFVTMFASTDENTTHFTKQNLKRYTGDTLQAGPKGPIYFNSTGYHNINGYMYGNLPVESLRMREGERVRWYLFSSTGFDDFHTPHWHGNTLLVAGQRRDVVDLGGPLLMLTADMVADNPGIWLFHCHFADHMMLGMSARYEVAPRTAPAVARASQ